MKRSLLQTIGILAISGIVGLAVNAFSSHPLPLIRPLDEREGKWPLLSADEVLKNVQEGSAILIDARDEKYFIEGHIPGALNLPAARFGDAFAQVGESMPRDFAFIVYCQGEPCDESLDVLDNLQVLEFTNLSLYPGGWTEWEKKEFPVEKSEDSLKSADSSEPK
jgi:rhodanese-related sulfurtransferase